MKSSLTDREWEVLDLICEGSTTRDIADTLYLSPETVNSHAKSVLKKLGVHSRAAAVEAVSVLRSSRKVGSASAAVATISRKSHCGTRAMC